MCSCLLTNDTCCRYVWGHSGNAIFAQGRDCSSIYIVAVVSVRIPLQLSGHDWLISNMPNHTVAKPMRPGTCPYGAVSGTLATLAFKEPTHHAMIPAI